MGSYLLLSGCIAYQYIREIAYCTQTTPKGAVIARVSLRWINTSLHTAQAPHLLTSVVYLPTLQGAKMQRLQGTEQLLEIILSQLNPYDSEGEDVHLQLSSASELSSGKIFPPSCFHFRGD